MIDACLLEGEWMVILTAVSAAANTKTLAGAKCAVILRGASNTTAAAVVAVPQDVDASTAAKISTLRAIAAYSLVTVRV
jgi:hypothetical protein